MTIGDRQASGDFGTMYINGLDMSGDATNIGANTAFKQNTSPHMNTGVEQFAVGPFMPSMTFNGYRRGPAIESTKSAHTLLATNQVGGNADTEYICTALMGINAQAAAGDPAILFTGARPKYDAPNNPSDILKFNASFAARGKRGGLGNVLLESDGVAGTLTGAYFDRGAMAAGGTTKGGIAHFQVLTPSGTKASGTATFSGIPSDGDTLTVNTTVYRFKNSTSTINDIAIGSTLAETILNLYYAVIGSVTQSGVGYVAGTAAPTGMTAAYPTSTTITFTASATGIAANSYSFAKTGTAIAVSGANMSGGTDGDTYTYTVGCATTSGGAYTTIATSALNGQSVGADRIEIPVTTSVKQFLKGFATPSSGGAAIRVSISVVIFWN